MKKKIGLLILSLPFLFVACKPSIDNLIDDYEKAMDNGNLVKASKIAGKLEKRQDEISLSQASKIAAIAAKETEKQMSSFSENIEDDLEDEW